MSTDQGKKQVTITQVFDNLNGNIQAQLVDIRRMCIQADQIIGSLGAKIKEQEKEAAEKEADSKRTTKK